MENKAQGKQYGRILPHSTLLGSLPRVPLLSYQQLLLYWKNQSNQYLLSTYISWTIKDC